MLEEKLEELPCVESWKRDLRLAGCKERYHDFGKFKCKFSLLRSESWIIKISIGIKIKSYLTDIDDFSKVNLFKVHLKINA